MKPRISMITLGVTDLERSRRFYQEGLGFPLRAESTDEVAFFDLRGAWLGLWGRNNLAEDAEVRDDGSGFRGMALAHNVETREEVQAVIDQAVSAGGTQVKAAADTSWGGSNGYFADPDGFLWEIAWNPFMPELAD